MKNPVTVQHENFPDTHHDAYSRMNFGFWLYLMTDFILFGALFAVYAVLNNSTMGGPGPGQLFHPDFTLTQTFMLLFSSLTAGLGGASAHRKDVKRTFQFFIATFVLGAVFMGMEFAEFSRLIQAGNSWDKNAFLSAYFTVVGTHGVHVLFALLWTIVLLIPVWREGLTHVSIRRLTCLRMFWQFLNIVWVFIFSLVYLMGVE